MAARRSPGATRPLRRSWMVDFRDSNIVWNGGSEMRREMDAEFRPDAGGGKRKGGTREGGGGGGGRQQKTTPPPFPPIAPPPPPPSPPPPSGPNLPTHL